VTVLSADAQGSMYLAEQVDPEEWHKMMECFFAVLSEGVHRFEGTTNQRTGDGIMALFGAPIVHEDHAQRACCAAHRLQQELRRYADGVPSSMASRPRCERDSTRARSWSEGSATTCGWITLRRTIRSGTEII